MPIQNNRPQFQNPMGDPVSTAFGTGLESFASSYSFGLYNPDIIPQEQEELYPTATTIGRIAGNVMGTIGNLLTIQKVGGLALTRFGMSIMKAGKVGSTLARPIAGVGTAMRLGIKPGSTAISSAIGSAATFSIHDVAQEFIRQTKENDPDLYRLATEAASGFLQGSIFGFESKMFMMERPAIQMATGGTAVLIADLINYKADGEEMTREDMMRSFLLGAGMARINSIGWKGRKDQYYKEVADVEKVISAEMGWTLDKKLGTKFKKNIIEQLPPSVREPLEKTYNDFLQRTAGQAKWKVAEKRLKEPYYEGRGKFYRTGKEGPLAAVAEKLGISKEQRYEMTLDITGGRTSSSKEITKAEASLLHDRLVEYASQSLEGVKTKLAEHLKLNPGEVIGGLGSRLRIKSPERALEQNPQMFTLVGDLIDQTRTMNMFRGMWHRTIDGMSKRFDLLMGTPSKTRLKGWIKNQPTEQRANFWNALQKPDDDPMVKALSPELRKLRKSYKNVTDFFYNRTKPIWELEGKQVGYQDFYVRHSLDKQWVRANGEKFGIELVEGKDGLTFYYQPAGTRKIKVPFNPTELQRVTQNLPAEAWIRDPFKVLKSMVDFDLKTIYLDRPMALFEQKLSLLSKNKMITDRGKLDSRKFVDIFVLNKQSEDTRGQNELILRLLDSSAGKGVLKIADMLGRDLGKRPADRMANMLSPLIHTAMIAGRPGLALRNMFQAFYPHGYVSTGNLAKALGEAPDTLKKMMKGNLLYNSTIGMGVAEEGMGRSGNYILDVFSSIFPFSHKLNVEFTMKAGYHQAIDYITNPKFRNAKGRFGKHWDAGKWYDDAGEIARKAAKDAKNPNWRYVLSSGEEKMVSNYVDFMVKHNQFVYDVFGLPGLFRNPGARTLFKLQSYPMNYVHNYIGGMVDIMRGKTPFAPQGTTAKVPGIHRLGLVKHFVGLGAIIAGLEKMGYDYSELLMVSPSLTKREKGKFPMAVGMFEWRPSPTVSIVKSLVDIFSEDPYKASYAKKQLWTGIPVPGRLLARDIQKSIEEGSRSRLFLRPQYKPGRKKSKKSSEYHPIFTMPPIRGLGG